MCRCCGLVLAALAVVFNLADLSAEDWPRWRGMRGDGTWQAPPIPARFPEGGPPAHWRQPIGPGFSGVSVAAGRVYTMDRPQDSDDERIICLDEKTGALVWQHRYTATYGKLDYGKGPRCTPTVHDGRVYTLGAVGHVHCLDAATGQLVWSKDLVSDQAAKLPEWGFAASPVIDGQRVIIHAGLPGGCYSAYDRKTGQELWRGGDDPAGYGTPILVEHAGLRQLLGWTPEHIVAHRLDDGRLLWKYPYKITYGVSIATPIFHEGTVLVCGYWNGSRAIKLGDSPDKAELLWEENRFLRGLMDQPLYRNGHVYLLDKQHGIVAFELAKGEKLWTDDNRLTPRARNPQVSMVWLGDSDRAICLNEKGELILIRLTPEGLTEDSRAKIVGDTWAHPAYAGDCCFARDDQEIVCVRLTGGGGGETERRRDGETERSEGSEVASPLEPDVAQRRFQLADDSLRIELAAAEPEVIDPVAIRFDEDGRMWVAEMRDYPLGPPTGRPPLSQIRVLEDRDGDGRFETAKTFADKLSFVTGLQPWKGGVFVTLAGAVVYMKDTDGDGRCNHEETWFEGFAEQNSQLRANHPRLALDNHIYVANGLRGGKVVNRRLKDQPVIDISGMDFRFDPLTGKAEAVSGNGQFGLCFDDWGNRFNCSNRNPVRHVVIEDRYLKASPGVTVPAVMHDVAAFAESSRIFPISRAWTTSNLHAGQFTAACGVYIYRGDLLPEEFRSNISTHAKLHPALRLDFPEEFLSSAFTCDPTGNLVHREIMRTNGPTFTSKPAYDGKEFLASPDEWFRPVNMELGPDGALYVVDMYRCVIEHPDFVPDELKKRPDLRLGDDRGRIWRIVPAETNPTRQRGSAAPKLSTAPAADLVKLLEYPNAWQRETAQRLLVQRADQSAVATLRELAITAIDAQSRTRALWTLAGIGPLDKGQITSALADENPQVRRQALLLAEPTASGKIATHAMKQLLVDRDRAVRFQAMLTLIGAAEPALGIPVTTADIRELSGILRTGEDPWMPHAALLLLGPDRSPELVRQMIPPDRGSLPVQLKQGRAQLLEALGELTQLTPREGPNRPSTAAAAAALRGPQAEAGLAVLTGMARRWSRGQRLPVDPATGRSPLKADPLVTLAQSAELEMTTRARAIALLAFVPDGAWYLVPLTGRDQEQPIRLAAISALARQPEIEHWQPLINGFASDTPPARRAILDGVLANADRTKLLLDSIEAGKIKASELNPQQANRLLESRDAQVKERSGKLFAAATPAERAKALADYQSVLAMPADAKRGIAIFEKNCAACHKIGTVGVNVAPDISDSRTKTAEQLLGEIILPNKAIDSNYLGYNVRLVDGTVSTGILTTETATSITLRQQGGKDLVVARSEIEELKSSGISLMPEGLERQIPPQDMADLLSFIKNWRYLDGKTPLASP